MGKIKTCIRCGIQFEIPTGCTYRKYCTEECRIASQRKQIKEWALTHKEQLNAGIKYGKRNSRICPLCQKPIFKNYVDGKLMNYNRFHKECVIEDAKFRIINNIKFDPTHYRRLAVYGLSISAVQYMIERGEI